MTGGDFLAPQPFVGGFTIACGQAYLVAFVQRVRFSAGDLGYLAGLNGNDGRPLFEFGFLGCLRDLRFGTVWYAGSMERRAARGAGRGRAERRA